MECAEPGSKREHLQRVLKPHIPFAPQCRRGTGSGRWPTPGHQGPAPRKPHVCSVQGLYPGGPEIPI
eukprot:1725356-Alexandrium_andersonii.AAC.1